MKVIYSIKNKNKTSKNKNKKKSLIDEYYFELEEYFNNVICE